MGTFKDEIIAGCSAGVVGTLLGYPLDSLKTRMQMTSERSLVKTFNTVYASEGILGLYRGIASPLLALTILNMLNFTSYSEFRKFLGVRGDIERGKFEIRVAIAAAAVGPLSATISTPFELLKTRMQLQRSLPREQQYRNTIHAAYRIWMKDGIKGLYVGHGVNTSREVIFLATYFSVYEHVKSYIAIVAPSFISVLFAGGLSGAIGWLISFPLDCIKSHVQSNTGKQMSAGSVLFNIVRNKGIFGLFSGVVPSILRAFIVSSSRFSTYEGTLWILK